MMRNTQTNFALPNIMNQESDQKQTTAKSWFGFSRPNSKADAHPTTESGADIEQGLDRTRRSLWGKIAHSFKGTFDLTDDLFDQLEEALISADIGVQASLALVEALRRRIENEKLQTAEQVIAGLKAEMAHALQTAEQDWLINTPLHVILVVGVNGVGKTTSTAKVAHYFQNQGKSVMLAAADTFRAAAVEQLQQWGKRLSIPVIAHTGNADAAAVAHDAITAATARGAEVLLIDTAGRLHTQPELMQQLQKVVRVIQKIDPSAPHEVMQVLDATTGQNATAQLAHFREAVEVSSLLLTKLDGSARGGVAISLSNSQRLPIRFLGTGEQMNDLQAFSAAAFADALLPEQLEST